ncbi:MAG: hypothetical protein ACK5GO_02690 [Ignavibacteria bacterium]|jgi:hypothetical protein
MKTKVHIFGIIALMMFTLSNFEAIAQKKGKKKGENVDWVKVRDLLAYNPEFMQEICCDCGPKTIEDILVGAPAIDGIIKNACKIAAKDIQITKDIEFIKIKMDTVDGFQTADISDGKGKKITAISAAKQLLKLTKVIGSLAAEAKSLADKKGPAQKEIEEASFLKKASLGAGLARALDILSTVVSETGKQGLKIKNQVDALNMLKDF